MAGETNAYHSAWRPATVYINGSYFGLYELREKFDTEYFETLEGADPDSTDILSLSAFVDKRIVDILAFPSAEKLTAVININMSLAFGLRGEP